MSSTTIVADAQLEGMIRIARDAAGRARARYEEHVGEGIPFDEKAPGHPVTAVDRELDAAIGRALREAFPEAGVVSEESVPDGDVLRVELAKDEVFFVDPIDGTREFINKNGEFAVMIGLARAGRAAAGVVALPAEGRLLAGRVGQRAFEESADGRRSLVVTSGVAQFAQAGLVVSRSHPPAIVEPLRRRLGLGRVLRCGSVGVKVARIVTGAADLYVHGGHGLSAWDTCAPEAVLVAAGGRLTDLDGARLDYRGEVAFARGLVASNGVLYPGVMSAVAWAEREAARLGAS